MNEQRQPEPLTWAAVSKMEIGQRLGYGDLSVDRVPGGWLYTVQRIGNVSHRDAAGQAVTVPFAMNTTTTFVSEPEPPNEMYIDPLQFITPAVQAD